MNKDNRENFELVFLAVLILGLVWFLSGCTSIPVKDFVYYGDEGEIGATYFHFLTDEIGDLDKDSWDKTRFGLVCVQPSTMAELKGIVEKACSTRGITCTYEAMSAIQAMSDNLDDFKNLTKR